MAGDAANGARGHVGSPPTAAGRKSVQAFRDRREEVQIRARPLERVKANRDLHDQGGDRDRGKVDHKASQTRCTE